MIRKFEVPAGGEKALQVFPDEVFRDLDDVAEREIAPSMKEKYLTIKEICKYLKISSTTVWRLSKKGILKPMKIGNRTLFARAEIDDYLRKEGSHAEH